MGQCCGKTKVYLRDISQSISPSFYQKRVLDWYSIAGSSDDNEEQAEQMPRRLSRHSSRHSAKRFAQYGGWVEVDQRADERIVNNLVENQHLLQLAAVEVFKGLDDDQEAVHEYDEVREFIVQSAQHTPTRGHSTSLDCLEKSCRDQNLDLILNSVDSISMSELAICVRQAVRVSMSQKRRKAYPSMIAAILPLDLWAMKPSRAARWRPQG